MALKLSAYANPVNEIRRIQPDMETFEKLLDFKWRRGAARAWPITRAVAQSTTRSAGRSRGCVKGVGSAYGLHQVSALAGEDSRTSPARAETGAGHIIAITQYF